MLRDEFQNEFWSTKKAMSAAWEAAYNRHGVRSGQQFILQVLWESDRQTPGDVARQLHLATPTVTRTASRMEAAGLLTRQPHPRDARLVLLCLTDRAAALKDTIEAEMRTLSDRALDGLSPTERDDLLRLLKTVRANLAR